MTRPSIEFELGDGTWLADRQSVGFIGLTPLGPVEFLITADALTAMLNPALDGMNAELALETFIEFEADIHRIARLEFVKRLGDEQPILITVADVEAR